MLKSQLLVLIILIQVFMTINFGVAVETEVEKDITPTLGKTLQTNVTLNLDDEWKTFDIEDINTGKGYFHTISVVVSDNLTSSFGLNEYYKIRFDFDLLNTVIDPEAMELVVEDGQMKVSSMHFEIELGDLLSFNAAVLSISSHPVSLDIQILIQTYIVPNLTYSETKNYRLLTAPTETYFLTPGSFSWKFHQQSFLFLDPAIKMITEEFEVRIKLDVENYIGENDKIRIAIDGGEESTKVSNPKVLEFHLRAQNLFELEISTLSEYLEFRIISVEVLINPNSYSITTSVPAPPSFGWIFGILMYAVSFLIVYKYSLHAHNMRKEEELGI